MQIDEQNAAGRSEYQEETYYFCSQGCKNKFDQNPEQFRRQVRRKPGVAALAVVCRSIATTSINSIVVFWIYEVCSYTARGAK
ncbi:MAG: YHS domain-containing protein [Blastocatellia bacterium]|nr:YHS domain-containing protein [Blastocatellia bacterium]